MLYWHYRAHGDSAAPVHNPRFCYHLPRVCGHAFGHGGGGLSDRCPNVHTADDLEPAMKYLDKHDIVHRDDIEALPEDFEGF